jgi:protein-S-isoprenylcysteine O-methyltransferase Ste14
VAIVALAGLVAFASVAFGWRVWRQRRRTGDVRLRGSWRTLPGVLVLVSGIAAIAAGTMLDLADAADPLEPMVHPVVQALGYVRNPIFTGMVLAFAGVTLLVPNVVALVGLALLAVGLEVHVRLIEEPHLAGAHGHAYRSYSRQAGRFVPWLGRAR